MLAVEVLSDLGHKFIITEFMINFGDYIGNIKIMRLSVPTQGI